MYDMTGWTPDVSQWTIVSVGFIQGAGLGFLFVPLTTIAFSTLPAHMRGDGTGLYNLSRNIGSSVGISIVSALLVENAQVNHETIAAYVTPFNRAFDADGGTGAEPADGGRPRGAQRADHAAIDDHRLYGRLQAADADVAGGHAAGAAAAQAQGRCRRLMDHSAVME